MINKLKQMIKQAAITLVSDDSEDYPKAQAEYNGKTTDYTRLTPYGLDTNPPKDVWLVLFSLQAQESVKVGMAHDAIKRFKNLKEGEVCLYNTLSKSFVYIKENGDIEVNAKNDLIVNVAKDMKATVGGNSTIDVTGDMTTTVGGKMDAIVTGDITATSTTGAITTTATAGNIVSLAPAGNITATAPSGNVDATGLNVNSTATVAISLTAPIIKLTGAIELAGAIKGAGGGILDAPSDIKTGSVVLGTHIHPGVTSGPSTTGTPI